MHFRPSHIASALGLIGLMLASSLMAQVAPPRDARNASFWNRIDNPEPDPLQPARSSYKPTAIIPGAPGPFLPIAKPGKTSIPARFLEEASQFAEANNSQALIIIHKGVVQLERYYQGGNLDTEFSSHSFAKTLNALAVGAAIADGHIASVDQPASIWLPEWRDGKRDAITLRQLLNMSGGFRNAVNTDPASHYMQLHYGADVLDAVRNAPLAFTPGQEFAYDNDNLQALGVVIARATKLSYIDYVSSRLWKKLGNANGEVLLDREGGRAMAYCCVWSKPRDWARVGQMLLKKGVWQGQQILPESWITEMQKPSPANAYFGFQVQLGAGWLDPQMNRRLQAQKASLVPSLAPDLYYLSGAGGLQLAIIPSEQLVILRVGKGATGWREQTLPNLMMTALHPEQKADWSWLYPYRMSTRQADKPQIFDAEQPAYWPYERVAGQKSKPLPRQLGRCLDENRIAPAMAELERTKSYSFLVWRDGAIEVEHYWPGFNAETRAESNSMHKSVLGLVVGQAIADGSIPSLDAPVSRWLTEWANDARGAITIRQMLQMASGLDPVKFDGTPGSPSSLFQLGADVLAVPFSLKLTQTPGTQFNYISAIPQLLSVIIERATGRRYADYLSQRLWRPIGAADAYVTLDHPGGLARTSAHLLARPEDWVRVGLLFADQGRINGKSVVDPQWIQASMQASPANPIYGFQVWRGSPHVPQRAYNTVTESKVPAKQAFLAEDMIYFDGAGARRVYVSPKERLVIVRLGNTAFDWDDSMVPNIVTAAARSCGKTKGAHH